MIRVVIDRWLAEGGDEAIEKIMRDLRREAIHSPGYVTGETLRDIADQHGMGPADLYEVIRTAAKAVEQGS
jgi:hypothetical protein